MEPAPLTDEEFTQFQRMMNSIAGIHLAPIKKVLVSGRLAKRVRQRQCRSFGEYYAQLQGEAGRNELQIAIDLLTTNETSFFRERGHFDFIEQKILPQLPRGAAFRVWSAACSSGEEPYSVAMTLAAAGNRSWEVVASDISSRVLQQAARGLYPMQAAHQIPDALLAAFCLKGVGSQAGNFLIQRDLRQRVDFRQINLNQPLPDLGHFDLILLRNVMIYFERNIKCAVVNRLVDNLKPGGYFMVGRSETLNGVSDRLEAVMPSIYRLK